MMVSHFCTLDCHSTSWALEFAETLMPVYCLLPLGKSCVAITQTALESQFGPRKISVSEVHSERLCALDV